MPTLLHPPTPDERLLLQTVAESFYDADDQWPIWQYVERKLVERAPHLDAAEIFRGMPVWQHRYRYLRLDNDTGARPSDDVRVQMTAAGIFHSGNGRMLDLLDALVAAAREAATLQRNAEPTPHLSAKVMIKGVELTETVTKRTGVSIPPLLLASMLQAEPATWSGLAGAGGIEWVWHLSGIPMGRFRNVSDRESYLVALEEIIGIPPAETHDAPLHPLAIHDALDNLNLAWKLATGNTLLIIKSMVGSGVLSQPVVSADEFERRCSAIATLLEGFTTGVRADKPNGIKGKRPLVGMKDELTALLGNRAGRAVAAADVLRNIVAVRNGQQHHGDPDAARARVALGLAKLTGNWPASWDQLQRQMVNALRTIREELPV